MPHWSKFKSLGSITISTRHFKPLSINTRLMLQCAQASSVESDDEYRKSTGRGYLRMHEQQCIIMKPTTHSSLLQLQNTWTEYIERFCWLQSMVAIFDQIGPTWLQRVFRKNGAIAKRRYMESVRLYADPKFLFLALWRVVNGASMRGICILVCLRHKHDHWCWSIRANEETPIHACRSFLYEDKHSIRRECSAANPRYGRSSSFKMHTCKFLARSASHSWSSLPRILGEFYVWLKPSTFNILQTRRSCVRSILC